MSGSRRVGWNKCVGVKPDSWNLFIINAAVCGVPMVIVDGTLKFRHDITMQFSPTGGNDDMLFQVICLMITATCAWVLSEGWRRL